MCKEYNVLKINMLQVDYTHALIFSTLPSPINLNWSTDALRRSTACEPLNLQHFWLLRVLIFVVFHEKSSFRSQGALCLEFHSVESPQKYIDVQEAKLNYLVYRNLRFSLQVLWRLHFSFQKKRSPSLFQVPEELYLILYE